MKYHLTYPISNRVVMVVTYVQSKLPSLALRHQSTPMHQIKQIPRTVKLTPKP